MPVDPPDSPDPASRLGSDAFRRVVRLARIELSEEEERELAPQLAEIVEWIDELRRWKGAEDEGGCAPRAPTADPTAERERATEPLRRPGLDRDEALERAPEADDGFFLAPPIRRDE